jgi:hypothetical protein
MASPIAVSHRRRRTPLNDGDTITFHLVGAGEVTFKVARCRELCPNEMAAFEEIDAQRAAETQESGTAGMLRTGEEFSLRFLALKEALIGEAREHYPANDVTQSEQENS